MMASTRDDPLTGLVPVGRTGLGGAERQRRTQKTNG
jgi:hypothetical protein